MDLYAADYETALRVWNFKRLLTQKYDVVVTNPPYMGGSGMNGRLAQFVKDNYADSKSDLFAAYIEKCGELLNASGYQAMITQHAWMFLSSYEKLRVKLMTRDIVNMAHLGARAFEEIGGEVVQTTVFVLSHRKYKGYKGTYARLVDFGSQSEKETAFLSGEHRYTATSDNFAKIPGMPISYWVGEAFFKCFKNASLKHYTVCKSGIMTGDDLRFTRCWFEVSTINTNLLCIAETYDKCKDTWFPVNVGGFRKWYGNLIMVVNIQNNGYAIASAKTNHRLRDKQYYFRKGVVWSEICTGTFSARHCSENTLFFVTAPISIALPSISINYILALLNSSYSNYVFKIINPTLHYNVGCVESLPVIIDREEFVIALATQNIALSRADWDSFETSWDFKRHPLV